MTQRSIPLVQSGPVLLNDENLSQPIHIGTPAWYEWLTQATIFTFEGSEGKFTARKEQVQRGGDYWKAYRRYRGKLLHSYLGKSEDLTLSRLNEVAQHLARRIEHLKEVPSTKDTETLAQPGRVDWGEAFNGGTFYGRDSELARLEEWLLTDGCRVVVLLGMGGIGKTALAAQLARNLQPSFDFIFWRSLLNAPSLDNILTDAIAFLSGPQVADRATDLSRKIEYFLNALRTSRCLIVLDNVETVLQAGDQGRAGHYRANYEAYGMLFQLVGEAAHRSCLVLTGREKPKEVGFLEGKRSLVRSLLVPPLQEAACQLVLQGRDLVGPEAAWKTLISHYAGNPLALKLVAGTIEEVFGGNILAFLQQGVSLLGDIRELLNQQFERLSTREQGLLYWLAIEREAVTPESLLTNVVPSISKDTLLEALDYLVQRRCWVEKCEARTAFALQPVIMQYITERLIEQVYRDISTESMSVFLSHALVKAQASDDVRSSQLRFILEPLADRLLSGWGKQGVEQKIMHMLSALHKRGSRVPGYAGANALHLLHQIKSDLRNTDFSDLAIWQAYLRGADLRYVDFNRCDLATSVFTERFGNVVALAFSPDSSLLAAGTTNSEVHVWRVSDGKPLLICEGHTNWVMSVAFSPDGSLLASSGSDHTIKLWDVHSGGCLSTLRGHAGWVRSVAFHPDGTLLASGSDDQTIRLWDRSSKQCVGVLYGHVGWVRSVAFHPDGTLLASGSDDRTIRLWDCNSKQILKTLQDYAGYVVSVAFNSSGTLLASGGSDHTIKLWDVHSGECLSVVQGHTGLVRSVAFHPSGSLLASGGDDQSSRLWRVEERENKVDYLRMLQGHYGSVWSVVFSPDGGILASGSHDQMIKLWKVEEGGSVHGLKTLQGYRDEVWSVVFSPDGRMLATGSDHQVVRLWDVRSGQCSMTLQGHTDLVRSVAFSPDGRMLASGSDDQSIRLWGVRSGQCNMVLQGHTDWVRCVTFSPDGRMLASGSYDHSIRLWNVQSGQCLTTLHGHTGRIWSMAFSSDGSMLVSSGNDSGIRLWDVRSGQCSMMLQGHTDLVRSVAFSPDGRMLATGSYDQSIKLWDVQSGQCLRTLQGHTKYVLSVTFSPDGTMLASGSDDQSIKLWHVSTGQCRMTLQGHTNAVRSVAFSPINHTLTSGSEDEAIKLWDTETGRCLSTLRGERPYEGLNIGGVTGLTEAEKASMRALGAIEQEAAHFEERRQEIEQLPSASFSERELQVLRLIARGASSKETAEQLVIALSTVKTHLKDIYKKLDVHTRAQAVARAAQLNML